MRSPPPPRNAAGREVWFRAAPSVDGGFAYRPVTGQGCAVMLAAVALVLVCGIGMMTAIVLLRRPAALLVGFVPLAIGLALVARTVAPFMTGPQPASPAVVQTPRPISATPPRGR